MTKALVTRLFVGGIAAVIAGIFLVLAAVLGAFASNVFEMNGSDVVGIRSDGSAWALLGLMIVGIVGVIGGAIAGLVSWIGALLNTVQLEDKTWFVLLLVLGLLSFGLVAMIAYVIAGPDGARRENAVTLHATW
jgi:hypothetical protein